MLQASFDVRKFLNLSLPHTSGCCHVSLPSGILCVAKFGTHTSYLRVHSNLHFRTSAILEAFGGAPDFLMVCCLVKLLPAVTLSTFMCPVSYTRIFIPSTHDTIFTSETSI
jgi:hypothetical protein